MIPDFVCSIPFRRSGRSIEVLLLERKPDQFCRPGFWQNVTGTHPESEWTPITALRETQEETGLKPIALFTVDHIHRIWLPRQDRIIWAPTFATEVGLGEVVLSEEHVACQWLSVAQALKVLTKRSQREALRVFDEDLIQEGRWEEHLLWSESGGWRFFSPPKGQIDREL
ncbi:MAG: hypothetical protein Kow00107_06190 [Planctomycetota bacterium]